MNNTALRATTGAERRPQSVTSHKESVTYGAYPYDTTHMVFANEEHEKFYYEKLEKARYQDCCHKALIYILGMLHRKSN